MGMLGRELKKQVAQGNALQAKVSTGKILDYDRVSNMAKVRYMNQNGDGYITRENVRIACMDGGISTSAVHAGQECFLEFANGNIFSPVIIGISGSMYAERACADQGACLPGDMVRTCTKPSTICPMSEDWADLENDDPLKYNNELSGYMDVDVTAEVHEIINSIDKYTDTETGMTHTVNKSTVRIKDNGDIDIFTANNLGIRVSPSSRSVDIYGALRVNGVEISTT